MDGFTQESTGLNDALTAKSLEKVNLQSKLPGFLIKLIIYGVVFVLTLKTSREINLDAILVSFLLSNLAYFFCGVFGFLLRLTGNYIIAIIAFLGSIFVFILILSKLGENIKAGSALDNATYYITTAVLFVPVAIDISRFIKFCRLSRELKHYV